MKIDRIVDGVRDVLSREESMQGRRVKVTIETGESEAPLSIKLNVPEKAPDEPEEREVIDLESPMGMLHVAMHILLEQMQLTQERLTQPDMEGCDLNEINKSMIVMADTMLSISEALQEAGGDEDEW